PLIENEDIKNKVHECAAAKVKEIAAAGTAKHERSDALKALGEELKLQFGEEPEDETLALAGRYYKDLQYHTVRNMILDEGRRLDGRATDVVRPLNMEIDTLPSPHGSSLFTRGETQSLTTVTLGTADDELLQETSATSNYAKFFLH